MLYLASASPRRGELLTQLGIRYTQVVTEVDETLLPEESPAHYVQRLAERKAKAGYGGEGLVLGADTTVALGTRIYGKPKDRADAIAMLRSLSATTHQVFTAVTVTDGTRLETALSRSQVTFSALSEARITAYTATGEPFDKAGAYAIQGRAAAFISHLKGSYSGVMGLPLWETANLLEKFGMMLNNP